MPPKRGVVKIPKGGESLMKGAMKGVSVKLTSLLKVSSLGGRCPTMPTKKKRVGSRRAPLAAAAQRNGGEAKERDEDGALDLVVEGMRCCHVGRGGGPQSESTETKSRSEEEEEEEEEGGSEGGHSSSMDVQEAGDLIALARMITEEGQQELCKELQVCPAAIEEQEQALLHTCRLNRSQTPETVVTSPSGLAPLERLRAAEPLEVTTDHDSGDDDAVVTWKVVAVVESDALVGDLDKKSSGRLIDVNSGGELFFVFFRRSGEDGERCAVVKFNSSRMATQGEALAYELAHAMGAPSAPARLLRAGTGAWVSLCHGVAALGGDAEEEGRGGGGARDGNDNRGDGKEDDGASSSSVEVEGCGSSGSSGSSGSGSSVGTASDGEERCADENRCPDDASPVPPSSSAAAGLARCLSANKSALLVGLVNGPSLSMSTRAFHSPEVSVATARAVGRLWVLDLLLANPDRFPLRQLAMRGNPNNVRWSVASQHVLGIDHTLARKPPRMMPCSPEAVGAVAAAVLGLPPPQLPSSVEARAGRHLRSYQPLIFDGAAVSDEILDSARGGHAVREEEGAAEDPASRDRLRTMASEGGGCEESKGGDGEEAALRAGFRSGVAEVLDPSKTVPLRAALGALVSALDDTLSDFFGALKKPSKGKRNEFGSTRELRSLQTQAAKDRDIAEAFRVAEDELALGLHQRAREADELLGVRDRNCAAPPFVGSSGAKSACVRCPGVLSFLDFFIIRPAPLVEHTAAGMDDQSASAKKQTPDQQRLDMCAVSAYELRTRLYHVLPRLDALIAAANQGSNRVGDHGSNHDDAGGP